MKCNEIIGKPLLALSEGRFNSYDELLDKEKLDNEKTQEHEWVEQEWSRLMNDKRRFGHIEKLWKMKYTNTGRHRRMARSSSSYMTRFGGSGEMHRGRSRFITIEIGSAD